MFRVQGFGVPPEGVTLHRTLGFRDLRFSGLYSEPQTAETSQEARLRAVRPRGFSQPVA